MNENNVAQINGGSATQLTYNIPNGPYPRRKAKVTLKLLDYTITYSSDISLTDKWIIVGQLPFYAVNSLQAFTINNTSYVIATKNSSDYQSYLWQFNPTDYSWKQINIPISFTNAAVASNGIKAYLYTQV